MIIAGEKKPVLGTLGINYYNIGADFFNQETIEKDLMSYFENNISGNTKIIPGGPVCWVEGKIILPFVTCSMFGGIISEILTNSLKHINKYLDLDRFIATLSLYIDGHGSHFNFFSELR